MNSKLTKEEIKNLKDKLAVKKTSGASNVDVLKGKRNV
tara:strand:+ start:204 stop:317 length:114 start_codon:yes stop_codon:yes gene_type:complete